MDKYCETKLISKMDIYFETEGVIFVPKYNLSQISRCIYYFSFQT